MAARGLSLVVVSGQASLNCSAQASHCGGLIAVRRLLIVVASLVVEHGL